MIPKACRNFRDGTGIMPKASQDSCQGTGIVPEASQKSGRIMQLLGDFTLIILRLITFFHESFPQLPVPRHDDHETFPGFLPSHRYYNESLPGFLGSRRYYNESLPEVEAAKWRENSRILKIIRLR
jgi:hypothetical protein